MDGTNDTDKKEREGDEPSRSAAPQRHSEEVDETHPELRSVRHRNRIEEPDQGDHSIDPRDDEPPGGSKPFWRDLNYREWITAGATLAAAFAAVGSGLIAYWTYGELDKQRVAMEGQLHEMQSGAQDTKNLVTATQHLADAGSQQADAMKSLALAGHSQADSMRELKKAGEAQATSTEHLAEAGRNQAESTRNLAENSARQLGAIQASADAAKAQASAVQQQAEATITASKATDRLANAGQSQASAVLQSLDVARTANDIASRASTAADRPWVSISIPGDVEPAAGQDYKVDITVSNVGRSPALNAVASIRFDIIPGNANFPSLNKCSGTCQSYTVFPTSGAFNASTIGYHPTLLAARMTADEIKRIADKTDAILLQVRIDYVDTSGNAHITESCNSLVPKFGFTSCNGNNGAN